LGKTERIKDRSIYVYLPSVDQKKRWDEQASKHGVSTSKFVIQQVENSLRQTEDDNYKSIGELWKENKQLKEQFDKEAREKHVLEIAIERLEEELRKYRAQPFLDDEFVGTRPYQKELVEILREGRIVKSEEVLSGLRINPTEQETVKAVSKQLENLESYGVIKSSPKGWRWIER
jgi:hypothetical protein